MFLRINLNPSVMVQGKRDPLVFLFGCVVCRLSQELTHTQRHTYTNTHTHRGPLRRACCVNAAAESWFQTTIFSFIHFLNLPLSFSRLLRGEVAAPEISDRSPPFISHLLASKVLLIFLCSQWFLCDLAGGGTLKCYVGATKKNDSPCNNILGIVYCFSDTKENTQEY